MTAVAVVIGVGSALGGLWFSRTYDVAAGGAISLLASAVFVASLVARRWLMAIARPGRHNSGQVVATAGSGSHNSGEAVATVGPGSHNSGQTVASAGSGGHNSGETVASTRRR